MMVESILQALRQAGYKATLPRRVVVETLAAASGHVTAPELVEAVQKRASGVGRASVYRVLNLLTRLNIIQASSLGGPTTTYVLTPGGHHHHVICTACNRTVEFESCPLDEEMQQLVSTFGFEVEGHLIELYGLCAECRVM